MSRKMEVVYVKYRRIKLNLTLTYCQSGCMHTKTAVAATFKTVNRQLFDVNRIQFKQLILHVNLSIYFRQSIIAHDDNLSNQVSL